MASSMTNMIGARHPMQPAAPVSDPVQEELQTQTESVETAPLTETETPIEVKASPIKRKPPPRKKKETETVISSVAVPPLELEAPMPVVSAESVTEDVSSKKKEKREKKR